MIRRVYWLFLWIKAARRIIYILAALRSFLHNCTVKTSETTLTPPVGCQMYYYDKEFFFISEKNPMSFCASLRKPHCINFCTFRIIGFLLFSVALNHSEYSKHTHRKNIKKSLLSNWFSYFVYSDNKAKDNCKIFKNGIKYVYISIREINYNTDGMYRKY